MLFVQRFLVWRSRTTIIFTLTELIAVKVFDWRLISLFELNCLVKGIVDTFSFYLIETATLLHFFETRRRHHIMHRHKSCHARPQGFAATTNLSSPGYNYLLWCRLTTLIWAFADLSLSYIPWVLANLKAKSDLVQQAKRWSIASAVIGERNSMEKSSNRDFCEGR